MHTSNPAVQHLAKLIGRSSNSIALRLVNFASVDPVLKARGIKGMDGGKKIVQPIWDEFFANQEELVFLSEQILAEKENTTIDLKFEKLLTSTKSLKGETKLREIKTRVNQSFFREIVLTNYSSKCAITGIDLPELLIASHIIPWAENEKERLNPENGLCLSTLYDKAFDKGFIGIKTNYEVILSSELKSNHSKDYYQKYFAPIEKHRLAEPSKYFAKKEFLEYHIENIFRK
jgi:putative restriction endonuclease